MLIEPLLSALSYAHQHGVVHGFLHPGNIWLFPRDQLKVWGFNFTGLEAERSARGWDFAAPEVRRGQRAGVRSDVWSVGAVLHFLYCGQLPSQSKQDSVPKVVYRCLAEDPARRYSGMCALQAEFSQESESVMDGAEEAMLHTTLANNYFRQFRVELAVLEWEKALAIQPDYPVALNNLGVAYWRWGRLGEATGCFRRAKSLLNLGLILLQQGDLPAAREALNKSIMVQPKHSQAYLALGECLLGLGKIPAGIEELHKALILNPQSARALRGLAKAYLDLGRAEEAESYREKSLELADQQLEFQPLILETPLGESTR